MDDVETRAFAALGWKNGEFSILLDEQFDIIWHSPSLVQLLGWTDIRGRNATEFVHADDLPLVLEVMELSAQSLDHRRVDSRYAPEPADIRLRQRSGAWQTYAIDTFNRLDDPSIGGVLATCRRVRDRADLPRVIEALGSGDSMTTLMPKIARLAERSMGGGVVRAALAWSASEQIEIATSSESPALDPSLAEIATAVWTHDVRTPTLITDFDDPLLADTAGRARALGYQGAFLVPIESPDDDDIIGGMIAWGTSTVDFIATPQSPLHVALRLAALAIAEHRTKLGLRWAATHDPLTGLANRAEFSRWLDDSATEPLVMLYIDLDDFKPINDGHGHPVGDLVLQEVAQRISASIGPEDLLGRLGGDEFAVIRPGTDDADEGRDLGLRIIEAIREPFAVGGRLLNIGASVGVAVGATPLIPDLLTRRADAALYQAKRTGKNTVYLAE